MKKSSIALFFFAILLTVFFAIYNSVSFKAMFFRDFYSDIFRSEFDVTILGSTVRVPLTSKFDVEHGFLLSIPRTGNDLTPKVVLNGELRYRFVVNEEVLREGYFAPIKRRYARRNENEFFFPLFYFDLPFDRRGEPVQLEVIVTSPMTVLKEFRGDIFCSVRPTYSIKNGEQKRMLGIYY
jgi:hypothetical protein